MNIPKKLGQALQNKERRELKKQQEERKEEQHEQLQEKNHRLREKKLFPGKLALCRKIFSWAEAFRQTEEGNRLIKGKDVYGRTVKAVTIGRWRCDPRTGRKTVGFPILWFDVTSTGVAQGERWVWMAYSYWEFTKPEVMAKKLPYAYLQLVWKQLESGKVFEYLIKKVKEV